MFNFDEFLLTDFGYTCQVLAIPLLPSAERLTDFNLERHGNFVDFGKTQLIYIIIMPFLLKNGPNSNKVEKGHILPLNIVLQVYLTPWIGKLRPVTPPHVSEVSSGHERSPTDRRIDWYATWPFLLRLWSRSWSWSRSHFQQDLVRSSHGSFHASCQEKHDDFNMNVAPFFSQKLLPKKKS